ncbi:MAG: iron chaperone [Culicoidibacterales bacterium]
MKSEIRAYINQFESEKQRILEHVYQLIFTAVPDADVKISYGMPAFTYNGRPLVYFAAAKNHLGFYPLPRAIIAFSAELSAYRTSKGAIQFPWNCPLPEELIIQIVLFRKNEKNEK